MSDISAVALAGSVAVDLTPTLPALTAPELAQLLNVSVDAVYDAANRGQIRHTRIGRAMRFPRAEAARLLFINDATGGDQPPATVTADTAAAQAGESHAG